MNFPAHRKKRPFVFGVRHPLMLMARQRVVQNQHHRSLARETSEWNACPAQTLGQDSSVAMSNVLGGTGDGAGGGGSSAPHSRVNKFINSSSLCRNPRDNRELRRIFDGYQFIYFRMETISPHPFGHRPSPHPKWGVCGELNPFGGWIGHCICFDVFASRLVVCGMELQSDTRADCP